MWTDEDSPLNEDPDRHAAQRAPMGAVPPCPYCGSTRLTQRHLARRILGLVGTLAGAAGSGMRAWQGAEVGGAFGAAAGPPGIAIGAVAGAVLGALAGGSTGCAVGVSLGDTIDTRLLDDMHCADCDRYFIRTRHAED